MTRLFYLIAGLEVLSVRAGVAQNPPAPPPPAPQPSSRPAPTTQSPQIDCTWLTVDSATKTATFHVTAGLTALGGGLNFNGFKDGGLTFTVPLNWNVVIEFTNHDGALPHSAQVIDTIKPMPAGPVDPAFPRAVTARLMEGIVPQGKDSFRFTANKAGSYLIFCAVPGHGLAGMWIRIRVSTTEKQPNLTATPSTGGR